MTVDWASRNAFHTGNLWLVRRDLHFSWKPEMVQNRRPPLSTQF